MCGIVGVASSESMRNVGIEAMMRKVAHRGPDDEGTWISSDRRVVLGDRRFAIIDLSAPMTCAATA
jgi:asparagine synthase (glutamine-hydrolysing)